MPRPKKGEPVQRDIITRDIPRAAEELRGHNELRFSIRNLFYFIRPILIGEANVLNPIYNTFTAVVADYERKYGKIPGLYRDVRGQIYHPHGHGFIELGTLAAETYKRPQWTFNKIIYVEKGGVFPPLLDANFPERHDCALLTSQGHATGAVCDVLDLLGDDTEEINIYCVHDADGYGTCIYDALQNGARARDARRVMVHNLGLEAEEGLSLGLQVEPVSSKKMKKDGKPAKVAVGKYVAPEWADWYQTNRIELSAMKPERFVSWLDAKMEALGIGKVIPPDHILRADLDDVLWRVKSNIEYRIRARIEKEYDLDAMVEQEMDEAMGHIEDDVLQAIRDAKAELRDTVVSHLERFPKESWKSPVERAAAEIVRQFSGEE